MNVVCRVMWILMLFMAGTVRPQVWMADQSREDLDPGITTPTPWPDLLINSHPPTNSCPLTTSNLTMGVGNKCLIIFRKLAQVCNLTIHDFYCICYKVNCPNKTLTPEEEEGRIRAQNELRDARLKDNAVEYAITATIFGLISITGVVGAGLHFGFMFIIMSFMPNLHSGNTLVLVTIFAHLPGGHVTNIFISNLALGDLLVVTICGPVRAYEYVHGRWTLGLWGCRCVLYLYYTSFLLSVFTLTAMSLERYLVICHPMRAQYVSTPGRARKIIILIWALATFLALPIFVLTELDSAGVCGLPWNDTVTIRSLLVYLTAAILGCPLVAMTYAYGRTCYTLWRSMSLARGLKADGSTKRNGSIRFKEHQKKVREDKSRIQVIKMLVSVLIVFVLCWTPTLIYSTMVAFEMHPTHHVTASRLAIAFAIIALANSCINPILYAFLSSSFRRGFLKSFRLCTRSPMKRGVTSFISHTGSVTTTAFTGVPREDPSGIGTTRV